MDYDRVRWLRRRTIAAASGMSTGSAAGDTSGTDPRPAAWPPGSAFGNTLGGSGSGSGCGSGCGCGCGSVRRDVVEKATAANVNLARVPDSDASRLDELIGVFQTTDHESADVCRGSSRAASVRTGPAFSAAAHRLPYG
ncbi:hypothetical protein [Phytohabitans houttuyneae]|uniref:hypothetical protein n=1 Tax=Phytohabitans houttuyneae TaxID=1076126 RepID=UPI001564F758|nr:hypothetical protein [Phytohabitans houttuyneae]